MNLEIRFKHPLKPNTEGLKTNLNRYLERKDSNTLFLMISTEGLVDIFIPEGSEERLIPPNKASREDLRREDEWIFKLSDAGSSLIRRAFSMNGEFKFVFYFDDQDPWEKDIGLEKKFVQDIRKGTIITMGKAFIVIG